jgi:hypothetical protein
MKHHKYIYVLLIVFPLLMSNSPSPYAGAVPYDDFTYTQINIENHPTLPNHYVYETTLTNNGSGYIELDYIEFISFTDTNERMSFQGNTLDHRVLKPLDALNFTVTHPRYIDDYIIESVNAYTIALDEVIVTVNGPLTRTPDAPSSEVNIPVTYSGELNFAYSAIVNVIIDNVPLSFITTGVTKSAIYLTLDQFPNVAIEDMTVESIVLVRGRANTLGISLWTIALGIGTIVSVVGGALTIAAMVGLIAFITKRSLKKQPKP